MTTHRSGVVAAVSSLAMVFAGIDAHAQVSAVNAVCESTPQPAFCSAVRGARAEGWPAQSRSEVMSQRGMVVTSRGRHSTTRWAQSSLQWGTR